MEKFNFDIDEIIKGIFKNDFVRSEVSKHNLTEGQIRKGLPILIDMANQDIENSRYIISFYVTQTGEIKRQEILSEKGVKETFLSRVLSQEFNPINFEIEKEYFKTKDRAETVQAFIPYLTDEPPKKGLYIHGPMGVGKTFTAKRFAKKLAERGNEVAFVNLSSLSSKIKQTFGDTQGKQGYIIKILKESPFLFIDDIGAEQITEWFRDDVLFSILNYRMDHEMTTFFTSNYTISELEKIEAKTSKTKYMDYNKSKRLIERIKSLSDQTIITGKNLRYK